MQQYVVAFVSMLSACLYMSVSLSECTSHSSCRPYSAFPSPSNLPMPPAGCYLSVRTHDFSRLEWGDFHVNVWAPLFLFYSFCYSPTLLWLGCNMQKRPCCRKALVRIPVCSSPDGNASLKPGRRERVESQWVITECAATREISEGTVEGERRKSRKKRQTKMPKEKGKIKIVTKRCEMFWQEEAKEWIKEKGKQ